MTIVFHRLAVPSYFGGLPANYDYINNATSGTPAFANGVLTTGPNVGSYFVGFQDDGTSADANRSALALATNTDYLDNVVHAPLAYVTKTNNVTPGAPVPSVTLTGPGIFLGISGTTPLTELFEVTDANDNAIEINGVPIVVASVTGGAIGSGFSAGNVTITFNLSIPAAQTYRVYYGIASSLAVLPADAFFAARLGQRSDDADFLDFVKQVSEPGTMPNTVTSLVATTLQTPDGTRLPQSSTMTLSVDPLDSGAPARFLNIAMRASTIHSVNLLSLLDDPTSTLFTGITAAALLHGTSGMAVYGVDHVTGGFNDNNINGGAPSNYLQAIPWTSATATNGDQYIRTLDTLPTSGTPGTAPESILQRLNATWACTVGDGASTFGDFNGAGGIEAALLYYTNYATASTSAHIWVKPGSYTFTQHWTLPGVVVLEGLTSQGGIVSAQSTVSGDSVFSIPASEGAALILRNMSIYNETAAQTLVESDFEGTLILQNMSIANLQIDLDTPATAPNGLSFYASDCVFYSNVAGARGLYLQVSDGFFHDGWVFERCKWQCADGCQPIVLSTSNSSGGTFTGVRFKNCTYTLGGTSTTSGCFTLNTGIIDIEPGTAGSFNFAVQDITWEDCSATGNSGGVNGPVVCIMPVGTGATSVTNITNLGVITMNNCTWQAQGAASAISPFFICARQVNLRDVTFVGTGSGGNAQGSDMAVSTANTVATADWGQITLASSYWLYDEGFQMGLDIENLTCTTFRQHGDSCDLRFEAPPFYGDGLQCPTTRIKNVRLSQYIAHGPGGEPHYRVNFDVASPIAGNPASVVVDQVRLYGTTGFSTFGWASFGLIGIQPQAGFKISNSGPADNTFQPGSGSNDETGFYINYGLGSEVYDITIEDCRAVGMGIGIYVPRDTTGSQPLDGFNIIRGIYDQNIFGGIALQADNLGVVRIKDTHVAGGANGGIVIEVINAGGVYPTIPNQMLYLEGNFCQNDDTSNFYEITVISAHATNQVRMSAKDNCCLKADGTLGKFRVAVNNGSTAIPSSGGYPFTGAETGLFNLGSSPPELDYNPGNAMMHNQAILASPA